MLARHALARLRRAPCALFALIAVLAFCGLMQAGPARAALGGTLDSVQQDQQATRSSSLQTALTGATRYTHQQPNGVTVRQYVSPSGSVFGVAWEGTVLPDFRRLLGAHFAAYAQAQLQPSRHISIRSGELVLDAGGMMRSFSGHAFLPGQLPATLSGADIR